MNRPVQDLAFLAAGTPRAVARAIEAYANEERMVSALVVPWESDASALSMAVTSAKVDGWAIEHTNLGTIRLADAGQDGTRITITADDPSPLREPASGQPHEKLARLFAEFARRLQARLQAGA